MLSAGGWATGWLRHEDGLVAMLTNGCTSSTTYEWKKVKIQPPARAQGTARAKRARQTATADSPPRQQTALRSPKTVQVKLRGGAEMWWEITWGGTTKRFPGYVQLDDALLCVFQHPSSCRDHRDERYGD